MVRKGHQPQQQQWITGLANDFSLEQKFHESHDFPIVYFIIELLRLKHIQL